jgi:hypothetical protein
MREERFDMANGPENVGKSESCPKCGMLREWGVLVEYREGQEQATEWADEQLAHKISLSALLCPGCGLVELYASRKP